MYGAAQILRPSLLVKVMIPPPSPPSFRFMSSPLSPRRLHIKPHLTSISVKETGASGCCLATTQCPPRFSSLLFLPYLPSYGPYRAHFQLPHVPPCLHSRRLSLTKRLISARTCYSFAHKSTCSPPCTACCCLAAS